MIGTASCQGKQLRLLHPVPIQCLQAARKIHIAKFRAAKVRCALISGRSLAREMVVAVPGSLWLTPFSVPC